MHLALLFDGVHDFLMENLAIFVMKISICVVEQGTWWTICCKVFQGSWNGKTAEIYGGIFFTFFPCILCLYLYFRI